MRLLLVTQDFPPDIGGIQTVMGRLAPRFHAQAEHFTVVAPKRPGAGEVDASLPFRVHRLRARPDLLVASAVAALPGIVRRERIDVAFHAQWQTVPASLAARRLTGRPARIVVAAHARELLFNPFSGTPVRGLYEAARRRIVAKVDRFVAVSRYTAGLVQDLGVPPERVEIVNIGTDAEYFRPMDASSLRRKLGVEGRPVLLTVSRLVARKGIDATLRALPTVLKAVPDAVYLIAGQGPDRERLQALAGEMGVAEHTRFLGRVSHADLPLLYNACDVFVMPSRNEPPDVEGFGVVFLEANACGKPVVGALSGGIPDAVLDGQTGLLVPPDQPVALATALTTLLQDPAMARRIGQQGLERVRRYGHWDHVAAGMYSAMERAMAGQP